MDNFRDTPAILPMQQLLPMPIVFPSFSFVNNSNVSNSNNSTRRRLYDEDVDEEYDSDDEEDENRSSTTIVKHSKKKKKLNLYRFTMPTSSRVIPNSCLEFEHKNKRLHFVRESQMTKKSMDELFGDSTLTNISESPLPNLVHPDCVVVRVLFAGGFVSNLNCCSVGQGVENQQSKEFSKLIAYAMNDLGNNNNDGRRNLNDEDDNQIRIKKNKKTKSSTSSSTASNSLNLFGSDSSSLNETRTRRDDDDQKQESEEEKEDENVSRNKNSKTTNSNKNNPHHTSSPGLTFVGKVVTAGTNVHFLHEWMSDPEPTSILPRGFREGDLVAGIQCGGGNNNNNNNDSSFSSPLSGTLSTYVVVPANFVMRIRIEDINSSSSSSSSHHKQHSSSQMSSSSSSSNILQNKKHHHQRTSSTSISSLEDPSTPIFTSIAANLLPTSLWYCMFRWHIEPKRDESMLFLSLGSYYDNNSNGTSNSNNISSSSSSSNSGNNHNLCVGACLAACRFGIRNVFIVALSEEEAILLENFEEWVRKNSPLFVEIVSSRKEERFMEEVIQESKIFEVLRWYEPPRQQQEEEEENEEDGNYYSSSSSAASSSRRKQQQVFSTFNHVLICDENSSSFSSLSSTEMKLSNENQDTIYISQATTCSLRIVDILEKVLAPSGTVGYLSFCCSSSFSQQQQKQQLQSQRIATSILPAILSKSGRFATISTSTLFMSPAATEQIRRAITDCLSLFVSGAMKIPVASNKIIRASSSLSSSFSASSSDQQHQQRGSSSSSNAISIESLLKQFRSFLLEIKSQENSNNNLSSSSSSTINFETRWNNLAEKSGIIVSELLQKVMKMINSSNSNSSNFVVQFPA